MSINRFVLDNGAYQAKSAYSTDKTTKITPNYITKSKNARETYVGSELENCQDFSGLFYNLCFHKGILVNWDIERKIWNQIFNYHKVDIPSTQILVTEPIFNFSYTQECLEELIFEELGFEGLIRTTAPALSAYNYMKEQTQDFCVVVDSGYSFTHIVPFFKGKAILEGLRRINLGGKHLTNYLKEVISYRQLMVMDETYVINQLKEAVCFVSKDFNHDMKIAKLKGASNTIVRDYVLPDYANIRKGYVKTQEESTGRPKDSEQIIRLNNERFSIPELLFHPSDIGIKEMGIPEAIVDSIESCFIDIKAHLFKNIVLVGGNALLPGFKERIFNEVRCMVSDEYDLNVTVPDNPITYGLHGGQLLARNAQDFNEICVSRKQYDESGHNICKAKFDI